MKILLSAPESLEPPRELDTEKESDLHAILAAIDTAQGEGRLDELKAVQDTCYVRLQEVQNYDGLKEGEWAVLEAVNGALATLVRAIARRVLDKQVSAETLASVLPQATDEVLRAILEPEPSDEDRLFREFYPPNYDAESDDSDEEDALPGSSRRTWQARTTARRHRKQSRRVYHDVDPSGALIRARMEQLGPGYGTAFTTNSSPPKLNDALEKKETYRDASTRLKNVEQQLAEWVASRVAQMEEGPRDTLRNLGIDKLEPTAFKAFQNAIKDDKDAGKQLGSLEKAKKAAASEVKKWDSLTSAAVKDLKGMLDWKSLMDANARIHHPVGTWTEEVKQELEAVNQALQKGEEIPENRFVVAQYRGIAYDTDVFTAVARRRSRESMELRLPVYCSSVFCAAGVSPADYYAGAYVSDQKVTDLLAEKAGQLRDVLLAKRQSGQVTLDGSMRERFRGGDGTDGRYHQMLAADASGPLIYENAAYALQNFYTINYAGFFEEVADVLERTSSVHGGESGETPPPGPLDEVLGGLLNGKNPLVSAGNIPRHALRYAYGVKFYSGAAKKSKLVPDWRAEDGRAVHPYAGKVFVSLHPAADYAAASGPLDVVALQAAAKVDVPKDILAEREAAFPALIPAERVIAEHVARYPSFSTQYNEVYLDKYGMEKKEYESFRELSAWIGSRKPLESFMDALSEWLVRYHEARLIELARRFAEKEGKILVYRDEGGHLVPGEDVVAVRVVSGTRSGSDDDGTRMTLGGSLDGRSSEEREPLQGPALDPQGPVALVGIYNYGNECYLNSALQLLLALDPAATCEPGYGASADAELRTLTHGFLTRLQADAVDGTYVRRDAARYTNQNTLQLRRRLLYDDRIRSLYSQEDACDALLALLAGYHRTHPEFDESPAWLAEYEGEFAQKRPSKLHRLVRITTTYELGQAADAAGGDEIQLNADGTHQRLDMVNILRLALPPGGKTNFQQVMQLNHADQELPEEHRTEARCLHQERAYPNARSHRVHTELLEPEPAHFLVQLKRFAAALAPVQEEKPVPSTGVGEVKPDLDTVPDSRTAQTTTSTSTPGKKTPPAKPQPPPSIFSAAKIKTEVDMPLQLDSGHTLRAFVVHLGDTIDGGHYVAYVRNGDAWYQANDPIVTPMGDVTEARRSGYVYYYGRDG